MRQTTLLLAICVTAILLLSRGTVRAQEVSAEVNSVDKSPHTDVAEQTDEKQDPPVQESIKHQVTFSTWFPSQMNQPAPVSRWQPFLNAPSSDDSNDGKFTDLTKSSELSDPLPTSYTRSHSTKFLGNSKTPLPAPPPESRTLENFAPFEPKPLGIIDGHSFSNAAFYLGKNRIPQNRHKSRQLKIKGRKIAGVTPVSEKTSKP